MYQELPGWQCSTEGITDYAQLPPRARAYLEFLGQQAGVDIGMISTGPERDQTILLPHSRLAGMLDGAAVTAS